MPEDSTTTPELAATPLTHLARLRFRITEALRTLEETEPAEMTEQVFDTLVEDLTGALHLVSILEDEDANRRPGTPRRVLPFVRAKGVQ